MRVVLVRHQFGSAPAFALYEELLSAMANALEQEGAQANVVTSLDEAGAEPADAVLLMGTLPYFAHWQRGLRALYALSPRPKVALWQLELLPGADMPFGEWLVRRAKGGWDLRRQGGRFLNSLGANLQSVYEAARAGLLHSVWADTQSRVLSLGRAGITARLLPLGYHSAWGDLNAPENERDIDVLFLGGLGGLGGRRETILQATRTQLAQQGIALQTSAEVAPRELWGPERNALIRRARIYLCVYRKPGEWSGTRFALGMANGALVVSEPVRDARPLVAGTHFVEAAPENLARVIQMYLADDTARQRICGAARELLRGSFSLQASARTLLHALGEPGQEPC